MASESRDLARTMLVLLFIGGLMAASFLVMRPFMPAVVWATTLVIATWPLMLRLQAALGGRRGLAGHRWIERLGGWEVGRLRRRPVYRRTAGVKPPKRAENRRLPR